MNKKKIVEQVLLISGTGLTNMFDVIRVKEIAKVLKFTELVDFIDKNKTEYCKLILTGEFE